jgi:hypothetical protein
MPVDRRLRGELADAIVAFMRDPGDPRVFHARIAAIHAQLSRAPQQDADHSAAEIADELRMMFECGKPHERLDSAETWEQHRRYLAFLRTERALPGTSVTATATAAAPSMMLSGAFPPRRLAWVLLLALLLSLAAWPWAGWYVFVACWIVSPLIWVVCTVEHGVETENRAWPFESDAHWREHERLLSDMNLPASWESSPHYRRRLPRWWHAAAFAISMGLLMLVLYVLIASIWPLLVIAMSLARYDETGDSPDAAPATR